MLRNGDAGRRDEVHCAATDNVAHLRYRPVPGTAEALPSTATRAWIHNLHTLQKMQIYVLAVTPQVVKMLLTSAAARST